MKIDKRDPRHWARLCAFGTCALVAMLIRPFRKDRARKRVVFYGHRLSGNLLPLYEHLRDGHAGDFEVAFLTMDAAYFRELRACGLRAIGANSREAVDWLSTTVAVVTDHGLHAMLPLLAVRGIRFFDVWHGIPFKGFDPRDFRVQRRYDEAWVASPLLKRMYESKFGFAPERVHATGYARTDQLVAGDPGDAARIRREFDLPPSGPILLFAPTWKQDDANRSAYPFGLSREQFLSLLSRVATAHGATVVVRAHLNAGDAQVDRVPGIVARPFATWPQTERLLRVVDLLVCDWSSIAFDFLLTDRPVVFLDVEPPFRKGFSLDASFRFGAIAGSVDELAARLRLFLGDPGAYAREFGPTAAGIRERVYGSCADGNATKRCALRLVEALRGR
jgi:CDP-glycerol glycerophosphotransferase